MSKRHGSIGPLDIIPIMGAVVVVVIFVALVLLPSLTPTQTYTGTLTYKSGVYTYGLFGSSTVIDLVVSDGVPHSITCYLSEMGSVAQARVLDLQLNQTVSITVNGEGACSI
jgi:hypothetical protein